MHTHFYIYLLQNKLDHKIYVGQSYNWRSRWGQHKSAARRVIAHPNEAFKSQKIDRAIAKAGIDNFTIQIIEEWETQKETDEAETFWIEFFESRRDAIGYNRKKGGQSSNGWKQSEETKKRVSERQKSPLWPSDEVVLEMATRLTAAEMARQIGLSPHTVIKRVKRLGSTFLIKGDRGFNHTFAKFTEESLLGLIADFDAGTYSKSELAEKYGVSRTYIDVILRGERWAKITGCKQQGPSSKLSKEQAIKIVQLYDTGNYTQKELAVMFGIHHNGICRVITGNAWSSATGIDPDVVVSHAKSGEDNALAKLTSKQVLEIVALYATDNYSQSDLAHQFGVSLAQIQRILSGERWGTLTGIQKGSSQRKGSKCRSTKLTEEQVLEIVKLYMTSNYTQKELSIMFGISRNAIASIASGKSWAHLTGIDYSGRTDRRKRK
jgi:group I intron endonuclease